MGKGVEIFGGLFVFTLSLIHILIIAKGDHVGEGHAQMAA